MDASNLLTLTTGALKSTLYALLTLCLLLGSFFAPTARAANMYYSGESPFAQLHIEGEIRHGDYKKMLALIKRQRDIPYQLVLKSKGGNVMEALKIGSFTRKYLLGFESTQCNSACVFIAIASLHHRHDKYGNFGLHRPKFNPAYFSKLNAQQAREKYTKLRTIVENYMFSMGASKALVDTLFSTASNAMSYLPKTAVYAMLRSPEGYSEWIISKCGDDLTKSEQHDLYHLQITNSSSNKKRLARLDAKSTEHFHCELEAVRSEQVRLYNVDSIFQSTHIPTQ
jgi:hypothetical protein